MKAGVIVSSLFAATAGQHSLSQNGWQQQSVSVADRNAAQSAQSIVNTIIANAIYQHNFSISNCPKISNNKKNVHSIMRF